MQNAKSHLPLKNLHQLLWDWQTLNRSIFNKAVSGKSSFSCRRENPIIVACSLTGSIVYLQQVVRYQHLTSPASMTKHSGIKKKRECILLLPSRVTQLLLISWLLHIFPEDSEPQPTKKIHPNNIPTRKGSHSGRVLFFQLHLPSHCCWGSSRTGSARERRFKAESFFYFCVPEFSCLCHDQPYTQHFCNISHALVSCTPSCFLLSSSRILLENTSQWRSPISWFLKWRAKLQGWFFCLFGLLVFLMKVNWSTVCCGVLVGVFWYFFGWNSLILLSVRLDDCLSWNTHPQISHQWLQGLSLN